MKVAVSPPRQLLTNLSFGKEGLLVVSFLVFLCLHLPSSTAHSFIGFSTAYCDNYGCKEVIITTLDDVSGKTENMSVVPYADIFGQSVDLIHSVFDHVHQRLLLLYADYTPVLETAVELATAKPVVVSFDLNTMAFEYEVVEDKVSGLYSTCYWDGPVMYGLGWLPGDSPYTLKVFSLTTDGYIITTISQLPGSYLAMPDCAYNPQSNRLYFYSRNVGVLPHLLNIWEVDVYNQAISNVWAVNGSHWSQAYLLNYNTADNNMYGIVADGHLNAWLVMFNLTSSSDPFIKIRQITDTIVDTTVITYDTDTEEFVYIDRDSGDIVSVGKTTLRREPIKGSPPQSIKNIHLRK